VADLGPLHQSGVAAWVAWLLVHIFFLIGFENRLMVMLQWTWSYFTYERGARLITRPWPLYAQAQAAGVTTPDAQREASTPAGVRTG
jgi:hypothetical protein